jgi:hypothetical protein
MKAGMEVIKIIGGTLTKTAGEIHIPVDQQKILLQI